ncbi:hypothetical protein ACFY93_11575 [Streptomyces sp. NPDC008313]|uniref:hypothetical protein n=1 Tax=Streptomyces sp. NPDC008313 TaxID=3364826 RepID=UPI0036F1741D
MVRARSGVAAVAVVLMAVAGCSPTDSDTGGAKGSGGREEPAAGGAALAAVDALTVKGRAPKTGYDRDRFGTAWADTDSNSCDTRVIFMVRAVVGLFSQRMQGVVGCA